MSSEGNYAAFISAVENAARAKAKIVVRLRNGLGNRLSGLLSAVVVAEKLNLDVEAYWPRDRVACAASFHELFEPVEWERITFLEEYPEDIAWTHYGDVTGDLLARAATSGGTLHIDAFNFFGGDIFGPFEYHERVRANLQKLQPVRAVREMIEAIPSAMVGLHVRMTDHLPSRVVTPRWCYREALRTLLQRSPEVRVFVCSDTPSFVRELVEKDPDRVFALTESGRGGTEVRASLTALYHALAELWLLSRCRVILASPPSSFATLATVLSGGHFVRIAGWPQSFAWRLEKVMWRIYHFLWFNLSTHAWTMRGDRGRWFKLGSLPSLALSRFLCSRFYQDRALPGQREGLQNRLKISLASVDLRESKPAERYT